MEPTDELERRRNKIRKELADVGDLRPGSLVARYRKCGKPSCHCAGQGERGHGPSWSLTRRVEGKTVTKVIPANAVPQTQAQIAEHRRLRRLTAELVEVSESLCDAQLTAQDAGASVELKKGASNKLLTGKSSPRSKPS